MAPGLTLREYGAPGVLGTRVGTRFKGSWLKVEET